MNLYKSYKTSRYLLYEPIACMIPWNYILRNLILSNLSKFIILYWNATGKIKTHLNQKWQHQSLNLKLLFSIYWNIIYERQLDAQEGWKYINTLNLFHFAKHVQHLQPRLCWSDTIFKINTYSKRQVCGKKYRNYTCGMLFCKTFLHTKNG